MPDVMVIPLWLCLLGLDSGICTTPNVMVIQLTYIKMIFWVSGVFGDKGHPGKHPQSHDRGSERNKC